MEKPTSPAETSEPQGPVSEPAPGQLSCPEPLPGVLPLEERRDFPTRFARLFFGVITLIVLYYTYAIIKPFLIDIFLALVVFFTAKPLYRGLTRLVWGQKVLASALTCIILAFLIFLPLFTLVSIIANQALEFSSTISKGLASDHLWQWVNAKTEAIKAYLAHLNLPLPPEQIKMESLVRTLLGRASTFIYENSIGLLKGFTSFFIDLVLVLFIAFFMFLQGDDFIKEIKSLSPLDTSYNEKIVQEMEAVIKATLWGSVVVAFIQGILGGVGFWLFGVPQAAFWGTIMIPASVIPVVGNAIIWVPGCLYLFLKGHQGYAVGLLLWCVVLIGSIDNILKPLLMKGTRPTPTIFILLSILGGISYFGMIGFILGPLILSFLLSLLEIYRKAILEPATGPVIVPATPVLEKAEPTAPAGDGF